MGMNPKILTNHSVISKQWKVTVSQGVKSLFPTVGSLLRSVALVGVSMKGYITITDFVFVMQKAIVHHVNLIH